MRGPSITTTNTPSALLYQTPETSESSSMRYNRRYDPQHSQNGTSKVRCHSPWWLPPSGTDVLSSQNLEKFKCQCQLEALSVTTTEVRGQPVRSDFPDWILVSGTCTCEETLSVFSSKWPLFPSLHTSQPVRSPPEEIVRFKKSAKFYCHIHKMCDFALKCIN